MDSQTKTSENAIELELTIDQMPLPTQKMAITMNFGVFDLIGFIGVLLIIIAYLLLQLEKLPSTAPRYSLLNAAGALLIMVSLVFAFNLSAFIVEAFWFLISLLGLWRSLSGRRNSNPGQQ